jgi:hypothetical protein
MEALLSVRARDSYRDSAFYSIERGAVSRLILMNDLKLSELPTSSEVGFLIHRPDSIPTHPKPQAPSRAFPSEAFGKAGYGGHDLRRRIFGLSHPYGGMIEEADT